MEPDRHIYLLLLPLLLLKKTKYSVGTLKIGRKISEEDEIFSRYIKDWEEDMTRWEKEDEILARVYASNNEIMSYLCQEAERPNPNPNPNPSLHPQIPSPMAAHRARDWAHLPPELLGSIAIKLIQIADLVRFSSVCLQWRSAVKSITDLLPPQLPWLLLPADNRTTTNHRLFFNLADNRTYNFPLIESRRTRTNKIHPSPFGGWILTPKDIETLTLTNPLTRSSIPLPPLPLTESQRKNIGAYVLGKAKVLDSNLVAVIFPHGSDILLCRLGESLWRRIELKGYSANDFVHHNGSFYVSHGETLSVFDVRTLKKIAGIPLVEGFSVCDYLVESPQGELLLVRRKGERKTFELFRMDTSGEKKVWIELTNIGDNVVFVDGVQAMVFCAGDLEGCRGNCIYFVADYPGGLQNKGLKVFNMDNGRVEDDPLFSFFTRGYWGKALWVVPSLG